MEYEEKLSQEYDEKIARELRRDLYLMFH